VRQRYDFSEAHAAQVEAELKIKQHPEIQQDENINFYLQAVSRLKKTLFANTDYVLNETQTGK